MIEKYEFHRVFVDPRYRVIEKKREGERESAIAVEMRVRGDGREMIVDEKGRATICTLSSRAV